jgi:hypothetical protein
VTPAGGSAASDPAASRAVRALRDAVRGRAAELRRDPAWGPAARPHVRLDFPRFAYGEGGIGDHDLRQSLVLKDLWIGEPLEGAVAGMRPEIETAAAALSHLHPDPFTVGRAALHLCEWLMLDELEGTGPDDGEAERRAARLVRSLRGLPVPAWINADLVGVAVLCPPLEFVSPDGVRVSLRATRPDDLGGDIYLEWAAAAERRVKSRPSALLRLEYEAADGAGWQPHLERAIAILQLFGVGGVAWTRAESGTESLVDVHGGIILLDQDGGSRRTYAIDAAGAARLPRFWEAVGAALPQEFYWHPPEDPVGLDAAWFNYRVEAGRFGYVNERIADVVRSLESLFLRDDESQRITEKLAGRAAALLGACGFDSGEVRRTVRWAYEVRSRYVHGAGLSPRTLARIEAGAGGLVPLLRRCLEFDRAALVAAVLSGADKPALLRLLEDDAALRRAGAAYHAVHGG